MAPDDEFISNAFTESTSTTSALISILVDAALPNVIVLAVALVPKFIAPVTAFVPIPIAPLVFSTFKLSFVSKLIEPSIKELLSFIPNISIPVSELKVVKRDAIIADVLLSGTVELSSDVFVPFILI